MIIKRTSWHYKVRRFGRDRLPYRDNLCRYFWGVVWGIVWPILLFCGGGILVGCLVYNYFTNPFIISDTIMLIFILLSITLPILVIWWVRVKIGKPPKMPCENIFFEYLRAKKRRICPLIEYID